MEYAKTITIEPKNLKNKEAIAKTLVYIYQNAEIKDYLKIIILDRLLWTNTETDDEGISIKYLGQSFWTEGALYQLLFNVNKNRRMRKKKHRINPYKNLRHEHSVPKDWIKKEFEKIQKDINYEKVYELLVKYGQAVVISKEEDALLNKMGLRSKMPVQQEGESFDVFARYRKVGLKVCLVNDIDPKTITKSKIEEYMQNLVTCGVNFK